MLVLQVFVILLCYRSATADFVTVTADIPVDCTDDENLPAGKPHMHYLSVESVVKFRYARTLVSTRIANPAGEAQEAYFSVVLPETAFISGFLMEVDGKVYRSYVKEKEAAKQVYDQAVQQGQTAAHVALTARDSNRFTVSVNLEPQKNVIFNLTYEELLGRKLGVYRDVINLDPGQIVPQLSVTVRIEESSNITTLKVPALKVDTEVEPNETNPLATIERPTSQSAVITFAPTPEQQRELAKDGIKGQFIVEYDVDRTSQPGEVLVNDGYFVHFFSPSDLKPLNKHVTFVLDLSGSMYGRKIDQLRQAMITILGNLNDGDYFSMVLFSNTAQVWDPTVSDEEMDRRLNAVGYYYSYPHVQDERPAPVLTHSVIAKVTPEIIKKAISFVEKFTATSTTDIYEALMMAIAISKIDILGTGEQEQETGEQKPETGEQKPETGEQKPETGEQKPEPIIVFLTDGLANGEVSDPNTIVNYVTKANTRNASIFSLALGGDADFSFLKKLSLGNLGFGRKIYEAADTALQLTDFYREISSPLLAYVNFQYTPEEVEEGTVTRCIFRRLFDGSEIVIAGKIRDNTNFTGRVEATSASGKTEFLFRPITIIDEPYPIDPIWPHPINVTKHVPSSMERMWAYLTIQQLLEEDQAKDYAKNETSPEKERARKLALKYSFVTTLTSLVVVKPNETTSAGIQDASAQPQPQYYGARPTGGSGFADADDYYDYPAAAVDYSDLHQEASTEMKTTIIFAPTVLHLKDITWLAAVTNDNGTITLPTGPNGQAEVLKLASENQTNIDGAECKTPIYHEPGHCNHLRFCVLDRFTSSKDDFLTYFCKIDSYVGVCCPDYLS